MSTVSFYDNYNLLSRSRFVPRRVSLFYTHNFKCHNLSDSHLLTWDTFSSDSILSVGVIFLSFAATLNSVVLLLYKCIMKSIIDTLLYIHVETQWSREGRNTFKQFYEQKLNDLVFTNVKQRSFSAICVIWKVKEYLV